MMEANYSCGIERDEKQLKKNDDDPRKWSNPLESRCVWLFFICFRFFVKFSISYSCLLYRLPNAPSMKIYCVYGHGKETEVRLPYPYPALHPLLPSSPSSSYSIPSSFLPTP